MTFVMIGLSLYLCINATTFLVAPKLFNSKSATTNKKRRYCCCAYWDDRLTRAEELKKTCFDEIDATWWWRLYFYQMGPAGCYDLHYLLFKKATFIVLLSINLLYETEDMLTATYRAIMMFLYCLLSVGLFQSKSYIYHRYLVCEAEKKNRVCLLLGVSVGHYVDMHLISCRSANVTLDLLTGVVATFWGYIILKNYHKDGLTFVDIQGILFGFFQVLANLICSVCKMVAHKITSFRKIMCVQRVTRISPTITHTQDFGK